MNLDKFHDAILLPVADNQARRLRHAEQFDDPGQDTWAAASPLPGIQFRTQIEQATKGKMSHRRRDKR